MDPASFDTLSVFIKIILFKDSFRINTAPNQIQQFKKQNNLTLPTTVSKYDTKNTFFDCKFHYKLLFGAFVERSYSKKYKLHKK